MSLVVAHINRPYAVHNRPEDQRPDKEQRIRLPYVLKRSPRSAFSLIPPSSAAEVVQTNQKVYDLHVMSKCRPFLQHPNEEVPALLFPLLPRQDVGHLALVNKTWSKHLREQICCDFANQEGLFNLLYILSAFDSNGENVIPALETFKALTPEEKSKALLASSKNFMRALRNLTNQDQNVYQMLRETADLRIARLPNRFGDDENKINAICLEIGNKLKAILDRIDNRSLEDDYGIPKQIVDVFIGMEEVFRGRFLMQSAKRGDLNWVKFGLNLEALSRIAITPECRGWLLYDVSGRLDSEKVVDAILKSGPIEEGELLTREGFSESNRSMRSASVFGAVEKNNIPALLTILSHRPIRGTDKNLEVALIASIDHPAECTQILLDNISYRENVIAAVEQLTMDEERLELLMEFRRRHGLL